MYLSDPEINKTNYTVKNYDIFQKAENSFQIMSNVDPIVGNSLATKNIEFFALSFLKYHDFHN